MKKINGWSIFLATAITYGDATDSAGLVFHVHYSTPSPTPSPLPLSLETPSISPLKSSVNRPSVILLIQPTIKFSAEALKKDLRTSRTKGAIAIQ
jgi:hypothetical protein